MDVAAFRNARSTVEGPSRTSSDGETDDGFGSSIALSGTTLKVGAPYHTVNGNADQGAAYIFGPQ